MPLIQCPAPLGDRRDQPVKLAANDYDGPGKPDCDWDDSELAPVR
jgi:hypothetical protein